MRAVRITEPGVLRCGEVPLPEPADDEVLIRVMASGICGTDLHIFKGGFTGDYPVIPGHEFSGMVEKCGPGVRGFRAGDRVAVEPNLSCGECSYCKEGKNHFCENWQALGVTRPGGMAEFVCAPESAVFSIGGLPFRHAAFMEPLSCVLHGLERTGFRQGEKVLLTGAGAIGLLFIQALKGTLPGQLTAAEPDPFRRDLAARLGCGRTVPFIEELEKEAFDLVIDATGLVPVMRKAPDMVRRGGRVLYFGVPPSGSSLDLAPFELFRKEIRIDTSFTSLRNSEQALGMISSGAVDPEPLITHIIGLAEMERGFSLFSDRSAKSVKIMVEPGNRE